MRRRVKRCVAIRLEGSNAGGGVAPGSLVPAIVWDRAAMWVEKTSRMALRRSCKMSWIC